MFKECACRRRGCRAAAQVIPKPPPQWRCLCGAVHSRSSCAGAKASRVSARRTSANGTYVNPIVPGDHPDPTILKDGKDYYMTFSSFESYPGLIIWHSRDLVNWQPIGPALTRNIGSVWALRHRQVTTAAISSTSHRSRSNVGFKLWAVHAESMEGPWSDPVDLGIPGCIDPGHAVGEDGKRYLFVNGIRRIRLTDDGLAARRQARTGV